MRDYSRVAPTFWTGETGKFLRECGPIVQVVAFYLVTNPSANMLGLYYLSLPTLYHETGLTRKGASEGLRRASEGGFAYYDEASEYVFVPEMARYQIGEELDPSDNRVKGIIKELEQHRKCPFFNAFLDKYRDRFHLETVKPSEAPQKVLQSPLQAPPKPGSGAGAGAGSGTGTGRRDLPLPPPKGRGRRPRTRCTLPEHAEWGTPESLMLKYNRETPPSVPAVDTPSNGRVKKAKVYLDMFPLEEWWTLTFQQYHHSRFLQGRVPPRPGHESFTPDFDWLLTKGKDGTENCVKVHDGRYRDGP